jgi:hypothetical protein
MNTIIDYLKRIFGFKPNKTVTTVKKTTPNVETVVKNHLKSDLNEITLKMGVNKDKVIGSETEKPKRKRYYNKKTTNKEKTTENNKKPVNTEAKTNGTTKKRYRSKKPKQTPTIQPESRTDN